VEHHDREGVAAFYAPDEPLAAGTSASLGEGVLHHVRVRVSGSGRASRCSRRGASRRGDAGATKAAAIVEVERVEASK
jgi:hypothetical protein